MSEHVADDEVAAPGGNGSVRLPAPGEDLGHTVRIHTDQAALLGISGPVTVGRILEVHIGEVEAPVQPGGTLQERKAGRHPLRLGSGGDHLLKTGALPGSRLQIVGSHRPEGIQDVGSELPRVTGVHHPSRNEEGMSGLSVHRQLEIHHGLQHPPSKHDHQLVLGMDVQGKGRRRIQGDEAEHGVPAPDEAGIRPAAWVGKILVGRDQGRELNLPHIVDLARFQRGHHPLIRHLGGVHLDTGQLQMVGSERRKDLDQLRALGARLHPAPGPLGQIDHFVSSQCVVRVLHPHGDAAGPDRGDHFHGQRLFGIDGSRSQGDVFVEGALTPSGPGRDPGSQLQIGKRLMGIDLVPIQVGADVQIGKLSLPPLDSILLDHPGIVFAPGFPQLTAGGQQDQHRCGRRKPTTFPVT